MKNELTFHVWMFFSLLGAIFIARSAPAKASFFAGIVLTLIGLAVVITAAIYGD